MTLTVGLTPATPTELLHVAPIIPVRHCQPGSGWLFPQSWVTCSRHEVSGTALVLRARSRKQYEGHIAQHTAAKTNRLYKTMLQVVVHLLLAC